MTFLNNDIQVIELAATHVDSLVQAALLMQIGQNQQSYFMSMLINKRMAYYMLGLPHTRIILQAM